MLRAYLFINKESQHVSKAALMELDAKVLSNPEMSVLLSSLTKTMKMKRSMSITTMSTDMRMRTRTNMA